ETFGAHGTTGASMGGKLALGWVFAGPVVVCCWVAAMGAFTTGAGAQQCHREPTGRLGGTRSGAHSADLEQPEQLPSGKSPLPHSWQVVNRSSNEPREAVR